MVSTVQSVWWSRLVAFFLSALAAGSAMYWVLLWPGNPTVAGAVESVTEGPAVDTAAVARALGGGAVASPVVADAGVLASSRFALAGVVAEGSRHGAALIAVDGKAARPFRVGTTVVDGWMLRQVLARRVVLSPISAQGIPTAEAEMALELPKPKGMN
jgi:general secretion pathway protein C